MLNSNFIAALNECVENDNPQLFGTIVRSEIVDSDLYAEGKDKELGDLLDFIQVTFPEKYFIASIAALSDFLLRHQFFKEATNGEITFSVNSICRSIMVAANIDQKAQSLVDVAKSPQQYHNLLFVEIPAEKKIVEKRKLPGQLKVFAAWFFVWNTIHQIAWDLILALVICGLMNACSTENLPLIRMLRVALALCTSIAQMRSRMNQKAKRRWQQKYG